jgi:hypothetical protein
MWWISFYPLKSLSRFILSHHHPCITHFTEKVKFGGPSTNALRWQLYSCEAPNKHACQKAERSPCRRARLVLASTAVAAETGADSVGGASPVLSRPGTEGKNPVNTGTCLSCKFSVLYPVFDMHRFFSVTTQDFLTLIKPCTVHQC